MTRRFLSAIALGVLLVGASFGFNWAGSRAYASEAAFVLYGSVATGSAPLPTRVRAVVGDVNCGSAEVSPAGPTTGFYALVIVPADQKAGCGVEGASVKLLLIGSELDPGMLAAQVLWHAGLVQRFELSTVTSVVAGAFVGALPMGPGQAQMRWTGGSGVPVQRALATIPREVEAIYFWDVASQKYRSYIVGAGSQDQTYTLVDADDIVFVRVK